MPSVTYEHNCFFCAKCVVLINVDLSQQGALPIADGEQMPCSECGKMLTARREQSWMRGMCAAQAVPWDQDRRDKLSEHMLQNPHAEMSDQAKFRTSMNAFKTGLHAKRHHMPPARHGKYEACKLCPHASHEVNEFGEGDGSCVTEKFPYCVKQSGVLARWINAAAMGKTDEIRNMIGDIHAQLLLIATNAADRVAIEGIMKELTYTRYGKDGSVSEEGTKIEMSPHFQALMDICDRLGLKLENFLLTSKSVSDKQIAESTADSVLAFLKNKPTILPNADPE